MMGISMRFPLVKIVNRKQRLANDGHLHRFEGTNFRDLEGMFGVVGDEHFRFFAF